MADDFTAVPADQWHDIATLARVTAVLAILTAVTVAYLLIKTAVPAAAHAHG